MNINIETSNKRLQKKINPVSRKIDQYVRNF